MSTQSDGGPREIFGSQFTWKHNLEENSTWKHDYKIGNTNQLGNVIIDLETHLLTWKLHSNVKTLVLTWRQLIWKQYFCLKKSRFQVNSKVSKLEEMFPSSP